MPMVIATEASKAMNIAFTYNVRHLKPDINNPQYIREAEFDESKTIRGIAKTLESLGHKIHKIEANEKAYNRFKRLKNKIDLVFNIAEGLHGADREAQIPAMLEMLQIPYTGPQSLGYAIGLNKAVAKEIMSFYKIPTPEWVTINKISYLDKVKIDFYPVIAKPLGEGSSKGIRARNLVNNLADLKKITRELLQEFCQPVLIEEYLPGREFTVAVIGNPAYVLPIIEITFDELPEGMPKFDHYECKWIYDNPHVGRNTLICPATISEDLQKEIEYLCLRTFHGLEMKDWARIDVRLDVQGRPHILEVNCPPGIMPDIKDNSRFPLSARVAGLNYEQMITIILKSACKRYGLEYTKKK